MIKKIKDYPARKFLEFTQQTIKNFIFWHISTCVPITSSKVLVVNCVLWTIPDTMYRPQHTGTIRWVDQGVAEHTRGFDLRLLCIIATGLNRDYVHGNYSIQCFPGRVANKRYQQYSRGTGDSDTLAVYSTDHGDHLMTRCIQTRNNTWTNFAIQFRCST